MSEKRHITRRDFLKLSGLGLVGLLLPPQIADAGLDLGLASSTQGMELIVPPEFSAIQIPERNGDYRNPENILLDAIDGYNNQRREKNLPRAYLVKGEEYLDFTSLAKKFPRLFEKEEEEEFNAWHYRLYGMIMAKDQDETVETADIPDIYGFSAFSQNGIVDHIFYNPGSGILNEAEEWILNKYGWDKKQLISSIIRHDKSLPEVKPEDWDEATKITSTRITDTLSYLENLRIKVGEPLSVSELIKYFLVHNEGDLKKAMWDSTLLLKILARNDVDTLFSNNTYDKAEYIAYLFKDEFSPRISHNWLMEQFSSGEIPSDSPLYMGGSMENEAGKNFMPINKDGTYYHVMNILTWAATCMDPWVVKGVVMAYYNQYMIGGMDYRSEHGLDKVNADIVAAQSADRIKRVVDWNA